MPLLARFLDFVHRRRKPAFVWMPALPKNLYSNTEGRQLYDRWKSQIDDALREVVATGNATQLEVGGESLILVPLFEDVRAGVASPIAVICTIADLSEVPRIIHEVHSGWYHTQLVHVLPQIVLTARPSGEVDYVSARWSEVVSDLPHALELPRLFLSAIAESDRPAFLEKWRAATSQKSAFSQEFRLRTKHGIRWHELSVVPWFSRGHLIKWVATLIDIDDRVHAGQEANRSSDRLWLLADVGSVLNTSLDLIEIADGLAALCAERLDAVCAVEIEGEGDRRLAVGSASLSSAGALGADSETQSEQTVAMREVQVRDLIAAGRLLSGTEAPEWPRYFSPISGRYQRFSVVTIPLAGRSGPVGTMTIARAAPENAWQSDDLTLLSVCARRLTTALENAKLYARERRVATAFQSALLPQALPAVAGTRFDGFYLPNTDEANVGGDWYDAFELGDGRYGLAIGDVAGHGLQAAIAMGLVRQAMRSAAFDGASPSAALANVNRLLHRENPTMTTAIFGILDRPAATFRYAVAGHPAPLVVSRRGEIRELALGGPPLGVVTETSWEEREIQLQMDDTLVLYTDGIVEFAHDMIRGERRLHEALAAWAKGGGKGGVERLVRDVLGNARASDDIASLCAVVMPLEAFDVTLPAQPEHSSTLRQRIRLFAEQCELAPARIDDLVLTVGEAVNNAIMHAYGDGGGRFACVRRARVRGSSSTSPTMDRGAPPRVKRPESAQRVRARSVVDAASGR